ncbi:MAG: 2'-5' RNA ligase family protein [Ruminococcaceae bacterium]|jgi:2'-5' RNA ligase|nr:2'-5' RNA ligase family protein [Oscillospiraceae bacterium]
MDYAVLLNFDASSEQTLNRIIHGLAQNGAGDTVLLAGLRPHLTLAEFDTDCYDQVIADLRRLCTRILGPIPVKLASAGFFPNNLSVLYLAPIVDEHLLDLHRLVNNTLEPLCTAFSPLYKEENWVPHCTVALDLDEQAFTASCLDLRNRFAPLDTMAVSISVIACCPFCEQAIFSLGSKLGTPAAQDEPAPVL